MSYTLVEASKYSNDVLQAGVIELLVKDNPLLQRIPFIDVQGNGLTYDVETTMPNANFYDVGETWEESTGTVSQSTAVLKILGGNADVDEFLKTTRSNVIDLESETIAAKTKAVEWEFMDSVFYGSTTGTKQFNGLHSLVSSTTYNTVNAGSGTGSALSIAKLREAIDMIKGTKPAMILSSKKMLRGMATYLDSVGSAFPRVADQFGMLPSIFEGIPWYGCDFITNTETAASGAYTAKTGGANTSIFILSFEPTPKALCGLQAGGGIQVVKVGLADNKDAVRHRIKWYCSLMLQNILTCAKVDGIVAAGTVTA